MLSYLALCALNGVVVTGYEDAAHGTMQETPGSGGAFSEVVLRPEVTVADASMIPKAESLHEAAQKKCFIAASVSFPVRHTPVVRAAS